MNEWILILFILVGMIFGSVVLYGYLGFSVVSAIKSILTYTWPTVEGKILSVEIKEEPEPGELTIYSPIIEYEYIVNQKEYKSNRFAYGFMANSTLSTTEEICEKFSIDEVVKVAYKPNKPEESILLRGIQSFHIKNILLFIVLLIVFWPLAIVWFPLLNELKRLLINL